MQYPKPRPPTDWIGFDVDLDKVEASYSILVYMVLDYPEVRAFSVKISAHISHRYCKLFFTEATFQSMSYLVG